MRGKRRPNDDWDNSDWNRQASDSDAFYGDSFDEDAFDDQGDDYEDDDFDYEAFVEENFSGNLTNKQTKPLWRLVSVVLLIAFALSVFAAVMN